MSKAKLELFGSPPPRRNRGPLWLIFFGTALVFLALSLSFTDLFDGVLEPEPYTPIQRTEPETILRIHGSNTLGSSLAPALAKAFLSRLGATEIQQVFNEMEVESKIVGKFPGSPRDKAIVIHAHGSSTAFKGLMAGECDIGASSRQVNLTEIETLQRKGFGLMTAKTNEHVAALDGVAIIVNPENPVNQLSISQMALIFSGEIEDWSELGGTPGRINRYGRNHQSGTFDTFQTLVMKDKKLSAWTLRFEDSAKLCESVMKDPGGIGFVGLPYIRSAKALAIYEGDSLALEPDYQTVKSENYLLTRRLYFYTHENPQNEYVRDFIDLALSDDGQQIARMANLVDLSLGGTAPSVSVARRQRQRLESEADLIVTLRFTPGAATLDNRAADDLNRFLRFMQRAENRDKRVILVAYGDAGALPRRKIESLRRELEAAGIQVAEVQDLGGGAPIADNSTEQGRFRNRRIEVFIES